MGQPNPQYYCLGTLHIITAPLPLPLSEPINAFITPRLDPFDDTAQKWDKNLIKCHKHIEQEGSFNLQKIHQYF